MTRSHIFSRCHCGGLAIHGICQSCGWQVVCGWCGRTKQANGSWRAQGCGGGRVSHGICHDCHSAELEKIKKERAAKMESEQDAVYDLLRRSNDRCAEYSRQAGALSGALIVILRGYDDPTGAARIGLRLAGLICPQCEGELVNGHCTACEQRGQ